jgi:cysteine desulfurase/selenocysteine lyase
MKIFRIMKMLLLEYAQEQLLEIEGLKVYGEKAHRTGVVSFNLEGVGLPLM